MSPPFLLVRDSAPDYAVIVFARFVISSTAIRPAVAYDASAQLPAPAGSALRPIRIREV